MKYKVGDRVRIMDRRTSAMGSFGEMDHWVGRVMTIRTVVPGNPLPYRMGEDSRENLGYGWGWGWNDGMIAGLVVDDRIHITVKGNTVHAILKNGDKVVRRASAKCAPGDEFDFWTGVEIALFRMKHQLER